MMQKPKIIFTPQEEKWAATIDINCHVTGLDWLQSGGRNLWNRLLRMKRLLQDNQGKASVTEGMRKLETE